MSASAGIYAWNGGGFVCGFRCKTSNNVQTTLTSDKMIGVDAFWSYDDLIGFGFKEGDSCWVSCDIVAGVTNYESDGNFTLTKDARFTLSYFVTGGVITTSWDGPKESDVIRIRNSGIFIGRCRVKTSGHETASGHKTDLSHALAMDDEVGWTFSELAETWV